ncbi:gamma-glutamylcyclotransferase-like [Oscarella lobularis]|uniref:gamma-glutamylcyclotransferase-like n=1 Tax=Oscarella lobularis TaxID=121494 RepID=UPI0033137611
MCEQLDSDVLRDAELYFGYGSNMSESRLSARGVEIRKRVLATLDDYEMTFSKKSRDPAWSGVGYCNINPKPNAKVYGILSVCECGALKRLDVYEGVAEGEYKRAAVHVTVQPSGQVVEAIAYVALDDYVSGGLKPSRDYLNHCLGGRDLLPDHYVKRLESFEADAWTFNAAHP